MVCYGHFGLIPQALTTYMLRHRAPNELVSRDDFVPVWYASMVHCLSGWRGCAVLSQSLWRSWGQYIVQYMCLYVHLHSMYIRTDAAGHNPAL